MSEKINEKFKRYRKVKGYSQKQISELALGKNSVVTVNRFETGKANPRIDILEKMLKQVGLKLIVTDDNIKKIVVVDIDGTISIVPDKRKKHLSSYPVNWEHFYKCSFDDQGIQEMIDLVNNLSNFYEIVFNTSRIEGVRFQTMLWLRDRFKFDFKLIMRKHDDNRAAPTVKAENLLAKNIDLKEIAFILDDDKQVCDKFCSLGVKCLKIESTIIND
jgi:transcriptional regulator with XRE-family HTH domain